MRVSNDIIFIFGWTIPLWFTGYYLTDKDSTNNTIQTYYKIKLFAYTKDFLKEYFTQKYKSEVTQDEFDEFVSLLEQIWRNVALHQLLTNGSSVVNGCRQNESPNSW